MEANGEDPDLQKSLDVVGSWCDANSLIINNNKSGILHVRPKKKLRTPPKYSPSKEYQLKLETHIPI